VKARFLDWSRVHPWTVIYLCVVATLDLIANLVSWLG
jgi:hypothetical protein